MGIVEIHDGLSTRRIIVDDLQGTVVVDCSGRESTVVVPEETDVAHSSSPDLGDDPGNRRAAHR